MTDYKKLYNPNRHKDWNYGGSKWKLSRSKIELFIECPKCFYLDNKLGTKRPSFPSLNLNITIDELLKREFDWYRHQSNAHPIMEEYSLKATPFRHQDLETWRNNFEGVTYYHPDTELMVSGAVDDIWINEKKELIVVDYKATSKQTRIESLSDSSWENSYKRQLGVYQWLLYMNGFNVSTTGYFLYANADSNRDNFKDILKFDTTLVPCEGDTRWIEKTLLEIKDCLENESYPKSNTDCEYCRYREACGKKLQAIYKDKIKQN